jgi:hypothetical protein
MIKHVERLERRNKGNRRRRLINCRGNQQQQRRMQEARVIVCNKTASVVCVDKRNAACRLSVILILQALVRTSSNDATLTRLARVGSDQTVACVGSTLLVSPHSTQRPGLLILRLPDLARRILGTHPPRHPRPKDGHSSQRRAVGC